MLTRLELEDPRWGDFVRSHPQSTPFHEPAWARLLGDSYGYEAFAVARCVDGVPREGLPLVEIGNRTKRRWSSLPFTDRCMPLASDASFATELDETRRRFGVANVELRARLTGAVAEPADAVVHTLQLAPEPDVVFKAIPQSQVRRNVKRAHREGVRTRIASDPEDLTESFYALHLQTRRRLGVPVQPRRFFRLLWDRMIEPGLGFVVVADYRGEAVAAAVFLAANGTVIYKFSASDANRRNLHAGSAVLWAGIEWGCEHGCGVMDLGRSDLGAAGLRSFKSSWGADEEPLVYSSLGETRARRASSNGAVAAVIRRSPPLVCRAVGELLYKYAA